MSERDKCLIISDFNASNLNGLINNDTNLPNIQSNVAPYGQVLQIIMDKKNKVWENNYDFAFVWTTPQGISTSFQNILEYKTVAIDTILQEVTEFCAALIGLLENVKLVFMPIWILPSYCKGFGLLDFKMNIGVSNILSQMNLKLSDCFKKEENIFLLNTGKWVENVGASAFNPKLWYMGKIAFSNDVYRETIIDLKSALLGIRGFTKKLIILDLDDTLWGGIVGDDGWENLQLGGHDPIGEAFADFQKNLKAFTNKGILLGIVSKNDESFALQAINKHPEMILKEDDFAGWRINWDDKAQNIVDLVSELNLGLQSTVFIDDSPIERERVRDMLPEVYVPEWPKDKMLYVKALQTLTCFNVSVISIEDSMRKEMYKSEKKREKIKKKVGSVEEWLKTLNIEVYIEELTEANLPRTIQLINKTNQMNLSTRRMTEPELKSWLSKKSRKLWTFRVSDKFGDSGLTGILSVEKNEPKIQIVDFILSCRVFGRKIEETMLYIAVKHARASLSKVTYAEYLETKKNKPCFEFFQKSGFLFEQESKSFHWDSTSEYTKPEQIKIYID